MIAKNAAEISAISKPQPFAGIAATLFPVSTIVLPEFDMLLLGSAMCLLGSGTGLFGVPPETEGSWWPFPSGRRGQEFAVRLEIEGYFDPQYLHSY